MVLTDKKKRRPPKMTTKCDILFENNFEKVYYGGQLLSGQAIVTLSKEKSVRGT